MDIEKEFALYQSKIIELDFSPNTITIYNASVKEFLKHFEEKENPSNITLQEFENYIKKWDSANTRYIKINSIKSFYKITGYNSFYINELDYPKRIKKIPKTIPRNILLEAIDDIDNRKHKALLSLSFSTGMWIREILNLKISDINFETGIIIVRNIKEEKNRNVLMSEHLVKILLHYIKKFNPKVYLFNGQDKTQYNKESALCVVKKCIGEKYTFQMIRNAHIYFLIESGINDNDIINHLGWGTNGKKQLLLFKNYSIKPQTKILSPI